MSDRCNKEFDMGGGMLAVCGRFAGHIPVDAHDVRERRADEEAPFGPWMGVPRERQLICAVAECAEEGKPHPCPYDGGYHHHGCIHYDCDAGKRDAERAGIKFRKGSWGLICDSHNVALAQAREKYRSTCCYCGYAWGSCTCEFHEACGFTWEGTLITKPNVDATGRFFVNPSVYYGEPYEKWLVDHEGCRA